MRARLWFDTGCIHSEHRDYSQLTQKHTCFSPARAQTLSALHMPRPAVLGGFIDIIHPLALSFYRTLQPKS